MNLLLSMPGGAEWVTLIIFGSVFFVSPVIAVMYFLRNKELRKQLNEVTKERDELLKNIIV